MMKYSTNPFKNKFILYKITSIFFVIVFFLLLSESSFSQGVAINTDDVSPHASAILDVSSSTKGVLIPRMKLTDRNAILSPVPMGLIIYQTDNNPGFYYYDGSTWIRMGSGMGSVTSIATNNGITGGTITTTGTLGLTGQALALHNLASNGLIARTGSGTVAARTVTAGTGITVTNGNGVSGNPTIAATMGTTSGTVAEGNHTHGQLHAPVTLTGQSYLSLSGQQITANQVNLGGTHVTGTLPIARGGTNTTTIGTAGSMAYSNGTAYTFTAAGTSGQVLTSNGTGAPTWTTPTTGTLTGTGTATRVAFWSGTSSLSSNANLYWNNTNSYLGIGTAAPTAQLHTTGTIRFQGAGTPGLGKVLKSDASGNATWQNTTLTTPAVNKTKALIIVKGDSGDYDKGVILFSPSGTQYMLTVDDNGNLITRAVNP